MLLAQTTYLLLSAAQVEWPAPVVQATPLLGASMLAFVVERLPSAALRSAASDCAAEGQPAPHPGRRRPRVILVRHP